MSYQIADFAGQVAIQAAIHRAYPNRAAELNAIAAALAADAATHDATITTAPAALQPGAAAHSPFTNDVLLIVNAGKGGNLAPLDMGNAITAGLANEIPPVNTTVPAATGTGTVGQTLSVTNGAWQYAPTSYAYQWLRNGAAIAGATAATRLLAAADSGTSVSCQVTATNAAGSTPIVSNAIAVA
jgi:hypothetical protein